MQRPCHRFQGIETDRCCMQRDSMISHNCRSCIVRCDVTRGDATLLEVNQMYIKNTSTIS
eukprot:m.69099 g.69099  ORF g.69099 m.69099 type:complete len:60 (-) comp12212_c0_seq5:87-266(-)